MVLAGMVNVFKLAVNVEFVAHWRENEVSLFELSTQLMFTLSNVPARTAESVKPEGAAGIPRIVALAVFEGEEN